MKKHDEIGKKITQRQFNELRNKIIEQKKYFTNVIETIKINQSNSGGKELNKLDFLKMP